MEKFKPITPKEADVKYRDSMNNLFIGTLNDFLVETCGSDKKEIELHICDIINEMKTKFLTEGCDSDKIHQALCFQELTTGYRKAGWDLKISGISVTINRA